ncbi:MAG: 2-phospho-L-lactate guanylyltransferase [Myxococcales bacterium]|nr:2-phospho-L-lactate guanylyltransferase [Myxococcales bacterium]MCB9628671.1 2-phospho-L-lactate guanylyltransferase [Sandaracinaceae bacterium]
MTYTAVVPVKAFARAKSRLASALPEPEREHFARACFDHVLRVLEAHPQVSGVIVSSSDPEVLAATRARGHTPLMDPREARRLNEVVDSALALAVERGAEAALVLMCDLPLLCAGDLDLLLGTDAELALAPDYAGAGTNALVARPPDRIPTCFGDPRSFALHRARAAALGLPALVVETPGLAGDVDTEDDYRRFRGLSPRATE